MKKLSLIIAAILILTICAVSVCADGMKEIDFYDISGMFEIGEDSIKCIAVAGDQMCVSEYYVSADEPFVYQATTNLTDFSQAEGTGALGLMLSVGDDPDRPIQRGCIIFRTPYAGGNGSTELWTLTTEGALDYGFNSNIPDPYELKTDRTFALVYDGKGNFYGYVDGAHRVTVKDSGFQGGYLGLLAWQAQGTYSNISVSKDISAFEIPADKPVVEHDPIDGINFRDISGMFEFGKDTVTCTAVAGDQICVSDYYVPADEPWTYTATTNLVDYNKGENNGALGLMISVGDKVDRPIQRGCIYLRTPYAGGDGSIELRTLSIENVLDYSFGVSESLPLALNTDRTYSLVYDGNGTFYGYADGELYLTVEDSGFQGGYLGLLAWQAQGTYSNISITVGNEEDEEIVEEEIVVEEPVVEEPAVEEPAEEIVVEEVVVEEEIVEEAVEAPQTFDAALIAIVFTSIFGLGAAVCTGKRK